MKLLRVGIQNYRNIGLTRLDLDAPRIFFVGRNGQGKTNILEAIGCITSLRAFRSRENRILIGPEQAYSEITYEAIHEDRDESSARIRIKPKGKEAWIDGSPARRVSDFVSRFPTVLLSSDDMQIARGSPSARRRVLDNFLCGADREYFVALQDYQKGLQERNALLKKGATPKLLEAFEVQMCEPAAKIYAKRREAIRDLLARSQECYAKISGQAETLEFEYKPNTVVETAEDFRRTLEDNRRRDEIMRSTGKGPHRDDFAIKLNGMAAADFASEGQQRSTVLALSLAIIRYWTECLGVAPVVLADDILGELDGERRRRFWEAVDPSLQFIATGTQLPDDCAADEWRVFEVENGTFRQRD